MNFYFTLSSCVPATDMETSGAVITAADLRSFIGNEKIVALAEMMN
jgi:adenine deaminase